MAESDFPGKLFWVKRAKMGVTQKYFRKISIFFLDFFLKNPAPLGFSIYGPLTSCKINLTNQWPLTIFEKKERKKTRKKEEKRRKIVEKRRKEKQANFIGHPATSEKTRQTDRLTD